MHHMWLHISRCFIFQTCFCFFKHLWFIYGIPAYDIRFRNPFFFTNLCRAAVLSFLSKGNTVRVNTCCWNTKALGPEIHSAQAQGCTCSPRCRLKGKMSLHFSDESILLPILFFFFSECICLPFYVSLCLSVFSLNPLFCFAPIFLFFLTSTVGQNSWAEKRSSLIQTSTWTSWDKPQQRQKQRRTDNRHTAVP